MADSKGKSWWEENVEDPYWEQKDKERALYQDNTVGRVQHDIGVGVEKGIYYGAKDMAVGLFEVAKWAVLLVAHDPETEKATAEAVIKGAKGAWGLTKDVVAAKYGTLEQKKEVTDRWAKSVSELGNAVSDKVKKDWNEASKEGKQAELISKYVSRVGFEAAALLVGAGEASAVAKTGEAAELASGLSKAEKLGSVVSECPEAVSAVDRTTDAAKAARALEQSGAKGVKALEQGAAIEKLVAGSPEHKAARWASYQERGGRWNYERWSKQYETNIQNAKRGLAREQAYREAMGGENLTVETPFTNRQIDIFRPDDNYMGQLKTGRESLTAENIVAIQKDATLVDQGYTVEYILEKGASKPFLKALEDAGISYRIGPQIP
jgi:hypothetical protein